MAGSSFVYGAGQTLPDGNLMVQDEATYLVDSQGNRYSGWFFDENENWLYSLNSSVPYGAMYVSTTTPDGFQVDENGAKIPDSQILNGWIERNQKRYYYENGVMVSNSWKVIDGKSYYFGSDGALYVNTTTPDGSQVDENGIKIERAVQFSDTSFVGWYCLEASESYYKKNPNIRPGDDRQPFIEIKSIKDGYVEGYYCDGSTGGGVAFECDFKAKINENGVAKYIQDHGGYTAEMTFRFYKENQKNKISLDMPIHKKSNFDSVADDYAKMELSEVNEANPYYYSVGKDEKYVKYR